MYTRFSSWVAAAAFGAAALTGCHTCGRRQACPPAPAAPVPLPPRSVQPVPPPGPGPFGPAPGAPFGPGPFPAAPPPPLPIESRGFSALDATTPPTPWRAPAGARLYPPDTALTPQPLERAGFRLDPPGPSPTPPPPAKLPAVEEVIPATSLPVGIPQFARAKEKVATGLKPDYLDGLSWLQANGYRAALHVRAPGTEDGADRKQFEKRGLRYLALDVPLPLTRETVEQFNRTVSDAAHHPLFVYDKDGMLAGGLWYLHARTFERLGDEEARTRATQLGLKEDRHGEHKAMWAALQQYLADP